MSRKERKAQLRSAQRKLLKPIELDDLKEKNASIHSQLLELIFRGAYQQILGYQAFFPGEIPLPSFEQIARRRSGAKLFLPLVEQADTREMQFYQAADFTSPGATGFQSVIENSRDRAKPQLNKSGFRRSLIIIPALAYDRHHYRLGRGGGFYDRFLAAHPGLHSVGVCYREQILDTLPRDPWDLAVDQILSA